MVVLSFRASALAFVPLITDVVISNLYSIVVNNIGEEVWKGHRVSSKTQHNHKPD